MVHFCASGLGAGCVVTGGANRANGYRTQLMIDEILARISNLKVSKISNWRCVELDSELRPKVNSCTWRRGVFPIRLAALGANVNTKHKLRYFYVVIVERKQYRSECTV
jgi:hypothetical protein